MTNENPDILAPELMPPRDSHGWCQHPGLEQLLEDGDTEEALIDDKKVGAAGYHLAYAQMSDELDDAHPACIAYDSGEPSCALWEPEPRGDGWRIVAIYDTEIGPVAMHVRKAENQPHNT